MDTSGVAGQGYAMEYPVTLAGQMRTFVGRMPVEALVDLSDGADIGVYLYCWASPRRGQGGHAHYAPCYIASGLDANQPRPSHVGDFSLVLNLRDGDPDLLKITACIRMKDEQTSSKRTGTLAASAVQLDRLLAGEELSLTMYDQFIVGNYTEMVIRATNASDYANFKGGLGVGDGLSALPLINLQRSRLWDIEKSDKDVVAVSNNIQASMTAHGVLHTPGGAQFSSGLTRYGKALLFFSLFLGTPAYALCPLFQRDGPAGNSGGLGSTRRESRTFPCSERITPS